MAHGRTMSHHETDTRVPDYLDDKLQTIADLDTLDSLLTNVQNQQILLKKQVWLLSPPSITCLATLNELTSEC